MAGVSHVQVGNARPALRETNGGEDSLLKLCANVDCDIFSSFLSQWVIHASCSISLQLSCIVGEREGSVISLALRLSEAAQLTNRARRTILRAIKLQMRDLPNAKLSCSDVLL